MPTNPDHLDRRPPRTTRALVAENQWSGDVNNDCIAYVFEGASFDFVCAHTVSDTRNRNKKQQRMSFLETTLLSERKKIKTFYGKW